MNTLMQTHVLKILAFEALTALVRADKPCVIAKTESGLVCGGRNSASNGDEFVSFLGIPNAKAPLASLRFAEPQHPDPIEGVFDATRPGPVCPQRPMKLFQAVMRPTSMSEDCLHVYVHVPLASLEADDNHLPVLAFVHGGSFTDGSGDPDVYGPEYLMTKGIIVVTFNYRINTMGFLSLNSKYIPGNAGLRDVMFALKWIQRNIKNFGGDPAMVTLGGVSAGSAVAHLVAISPAVKSLGVILMSGTAVGNFFTPSQLNAKIQSKLFLEGMNIDPLQHPKKIYQELIAASMEKILDANQYIRNKTNTGVGFSPVIETPHRGITTMVPKHPEQLIKEGYGKEYPTLFGITNSECNIYMRRIDKAQANFRRLPITTIPLNLLVTSSVLTIPLLTKMISREYFNGSLSTTKTYLELCSDSFFKYPVMWLVNKRLSVNAKMSYVYEFGYEITEYNPLKHIQEANWTGVGHIEDLGFIFRTNSVYPPAVEDELAQNTSRSKMKLFMTNTISNFVKFGRPGSETVWPATRSDFQFMSVAEPEPRFTPATPHMRELKRFFDQLYRLGRMSFFD